MIPTVLQQPSAFDLPLSTDTKYIGHDRSYSNLGPYSTNDYAFSNRKVQASVTNAASTAGLALPANPSLEYNSQSLLNHDPYQSTSQLMLSPPDSVNGSSSSNGNQKLNQFAYSTLPKPQTNNAITSDHFSGGSASVLSSPWGDSTMTGLERTRFPTFPQTLSPPPPYPTTNGISNGYFARGVVGRDFSPYHSQGPFGQAFPGNQGQRPSQATNLAYRPTNFTLHPNDPSYQNPGMSLPHEQNRQDGPPFGDTKVLYTVTTSRGQSLRPQVSAIIQKGFFQNEGKWTCYRRNYFTVNCSFTLPGHYFDNRLYLERGNQPQLIHSFAVSISAKTAAVKNQASEARGLVQHTPKRDKISESEPARHVVQPQPPPHLHNGSGLGGPGQFHTNSQTNASGLVGYTTFEPPGAQSVPFSYTFERIQFKKATANNGKRRAQQQYFHVVVELSAQVDGRPTDDQNWIIIATKESEPMVVRGRSPGHYKDSGRRDSQTSMDPDRGNGHGFDNGTASYSSGAHHLGSSMDWSPGAGTGACQQGRHYGGSYHCHDSDYSPTSATSSTTLTGSPADAEFFLSDPQDVKPSLEYCMDTTAWNSPLNETNGFSRSLESQERKRKRPFEEDLADERSPLNILQRGSMVTDNYHTDVFEIRRSEHSMALCASS